MLEIPDAILAQIHAHGEAAYPEEGAGFLLGSDGQVRTVVAIRSLSNSREEGARHNRYLVSAREYMDGELEAVAKRLVWR